MKHIWVLVLLLALLTGCGQGERPVAGSGADGESSERQTSQEPSPEETPEAGIKRAFLAQYVKDEAYTAEELSVEYIGRFDGYCAVYVHGVLNYTQAESIELVDGVTFRYATGQHLLIYSESDGGLYGLQEALDRRVLDASGLQKVYAAHREAEPFLYEESEAEATDGDILLAYMVKEHPKCRIDELSVVHIGVFGGCRAVYVNGPFESLNVITTETVGGLDFVYPTSQTMRIYRGGALYTLPEAWEKGVIDAAALRELHDRSFGGQHGDVQ